MRAISYSMKLTFQTANERIDSFFSQLKLPLEDVVFVLNIVGNVCFAKKPELIDLLLHQFQVFFSCFLICMIHEFVVQRFAEHEPAMINHSWRVRIAIRKSARPARCRLESQLHRIRDGSALDRDQRTDTRAQDAAFVGQVKPVAPGGPSNFDYRSDWTRVP